MQIAEFLLSVNILCIANLEQQKCSNQYNLLRKSENKYSTPYSIYPEQQKAYTVYNQRCCTFPVQQKCSTRYNLLGIVEMFCPVLSKIFYFVQQKKSILISQNQSTQRKSTQKQSTQKQSTQKQSTRNSRNSLLCLTYSEQQKYSTPQNLLGNAEIVYSA